MNEEHVVYCWRGGGDLTWRTWSCSVDRDVMLLPTYMLHCMVGKSRRTHLNMVLFVMFS